MGHHARPGWTACKSSKKIEVTMKWDDKWIRLSAGAGCMKSATARLEASPARFKLDPSPRVRLDERMVSSIESVHMALNDHG